MENIIKNATDVNVDSATVDKVTESGQQVMNGASDTVKTIGDYLGVDTAIIWFVAVVAIVIVWRVFKKLGKLAIALIIAGIILAATAGTFLI